MTLQEYLKQHVQLVNQHRCKQERWKYSCMEDFILHNGREMQVNPTVKTLRRGKMKECFKNAYELALHEGLIYCEGYALSIIPTLHAWCIDKDGNVIDPTWTDGKEYFGIPFDLEIVSKIILKRGKFGIIDSWDIGFPFLTGEEVI